MAVESKSPPPVVEIVGPTDGWILEKLARCLARKLPYAEFVAWSPSNESRANLTYYVNYALFNSASDKVNVGFFTHTDQSYEFISPAREMDHCVSMSKLYADYLREHGIPTVTHIQMGFDYYYYRPRLVLGVFCRLEHPRKGARLVAQLSELPFIELLISDGLFDEQSLRQMYQTVDYVLVPATVEGGPMCLLEGLCMGKPVIAPSGVGMVPEFGNISEILHYEAGNFLSARRVVEQCYEKKMKTSNLTRTRTWDNWARDHHQLFSGLLQERNLEMPAPAAGFRFGMLSELIIAPTVDVRQLEVAFDNVAADLYFGDYSRARSSIEQLSKTFSFVEPLLDSIPG